MNEINPEQIKAFLEAFTVLNKAHPIIGVIVAIIGILTATLTFINNFRTKLNTRANNQTVKALDDIKADMHALRDQTIKDVRESAEEFKRSLNQTAADIKLGLTEEVTKVKIVVAKVHDLSDQRLSMIPKIQDRLDQIESKQAEVEIIKKKNDEILDILTHGKKRNGL